MTQDTDQISERMLEEHRLRKTTFRKEVLAIFLTYQGRAITQIDIEEKLGDFDRITLYRTLKSFEDKGLIHLALDVTGQSKYALCNHGCDEDSHHDMHAHFHCDHCGKTLCLDEMSERFDSLVPKGYQVDDVQITFSGTCSICN